MKTRDLRFVVPLALAALAASGRAYAEAPSDPKDTIQSARELFRQAEADEDAGRWAAAQQKLERIAKVKLTAGVRYHIALCDENLGRPLAALRGYQEAEKLAREAGAKDVLKLVGPRLDAMTSRVPKVIVSVPPGLKGVVVRIDGEVVQDPSSVTLETGDHVVEATAPGRLPFNAPARLRAGEVRQIEVVFAMEPASAPPPPPDPAPAPRRQADRTWAIVTTGGAVVLAAAGVGAFLAAGSAHDDALGSCRTDAARCQAGVDDVRRWDALALGGFIGAAALGGIAIALWAKKPVATAPPSPVESLRVGPGTLSLHGRF